MKRLKNRSGFTLAETLMAVLILLFVSGIVVTGVPAARNAFDRVVLGANAQTMLSTAVNALRDELGTAWDVEIVTKDGVETLQYFNADTGARAILSKDAKYVITLQDYVPLDDATSLIHGSDSKAGTPHHLVPDSNSRLYATYTSISVDAATNIVSVTGLKVCKKTDDKEIVSIGKDDEGNELALKIRVLSSKATP